jgi:hypothetical protein
VSDRQTDGKRRQEEDGGGRKGDGPGTTRSAQNQLDGAEPTCSKNNIEAIYGVKGGRKESKYCKATKS